MLKIYGVPVSVHTRKVILSAKLKGVDHDVVPVIPFNPPANWAELSPTGLIPVIENEGFVLQDSTAICLYLDRLESRAPLLPDDAGPAGRALWFNAYAGDVFRHVVHGLFFQKVIKATIPEQGEPDQSIIDGILSGARQRMFGYLDSQARDQWLVADRLTLADVAVVSTLVNYLYLGFDIDRDRFPALASYMKRAIAAQPFRSAIAAERPVAEQMGLSRAFLE